MKEFQIRLADKDIEDLIKTYCLSNFGSAVKFYFEESFKDFVFVNIISVDSCPTTDSYLLTILGKQNETKSSNISYS